MLGTPYHDELDHDSIRALAASEDSNERLALGAQALAPELKLLAAMVDPEEVLIGGSTVALGATFLDRVQDEFDRYPAKGTSPTRIQYATAGNLPFIGAAQHALRSELGVSWSSLGIPNTL
jgi:predicted NBD/HSP70 family sugar kinase